MTGDFRKASILANEEIRIEELAPNSSFSVWEAWSSFTLQPAR